MAFSGIGQGAKVLSVIKEFGFHRCVLRARLKFLRQKLDTEQILDTF